MPFGMYKVRSAQIVKHLSSVLEVSTGQTMGSVKCCGHVYLVMIITVASCVYFI